jgi:hypothetical protein
MPRIYYKTYYRCNTFADSKAIQAQFERDAIVHVDHFVFNGLLNDNGTYSTAPSWFNQVNEYPTYDTWWLFSPPAEENTSYKLSWTAYNKDGTTDEYIVELIMLDYCIVEIDNCGKSKVLTWLNREGGWSYFSFSGVRTFEVKIPQGKTFQNADYIQRYHSRPDVYQGMQLTTGPIPEQALELLESLKYSVQAYMIEEGTPQPVYIPIVIQDGDFTKRKTSDKRFDVTVKFIFAEQVQIQTQ